MCCRAQRSVRKKSMWEYDLYGGEKYEKSRSEPCWQRQASKRSYLCSRLFTWLLWDLAEEVESIEGSPTMLKSPPKISRPFLSVLILPSKDCKN